MKTLLLTDRATGETERVREDSSRFAASIRRAANSIGIRFDEAMEILDAGQLLLTLAYVRKIEEEP